MNKDLLSGIVLVCIAAAYYVASRSIQVSSLEDDFGPHGLPNILAIALAAAGVLLVLRGAWAARRVAAAPTDDADSYRPLRALGLLAIGFAYVLLVDTLGYILSIALLIAGVALYEGARLSWRVAAVAAGGACVLWLLFVRLLDVVQPAGLLF